MNTTSCLMDFSPGSHAICIDTGATCCISNNKDHFTHFTPSSHKVPHGIGTGLSIEGRGTLCWRILNDSGDEISLPIHDCLYVPSAPMCLLSPQHMSQQTLHPDDGFHCKGPFGLFTFAGHHRTIHYNSNNNLPILFTATHLCSAISSSNNNDTVPSTVALLSSEILPDSSTTLTAPQRKLLQLHHRMGHLNMVRLQQLI
jgi:hypothetical protein